MRILPGDEPGATPSPGDGPHDPLSRPQAAHCDWGLVDDDHTEDMRPGAAPEARNK